MHMRHHLFSSLAVAVGLALTLMVSVVPITSGAPVAAHSARIVGKNVLPELSYGSPGFASRAGRSVLAWTGTDAAHHLNVEISTNGLTGYGSKVILPDTSIAGPAVAQMSASAGNAVTIAWTGTDARHRINVMVDVYGQRHKMTYNASSFTSPALTIFEGNLLLAWAGTEANHPIHVMSVSLSSLNSTSARTLAWGTNEGPTLATVTIEPSLKDNGSSPETDAVLGWKDANSRLHLATSSSGLLFGKTVTLAEWSPFGPSVMQYSTEGGPQFWIAWTGTDSAHHLNVKWTNPSTFPTFSGATTTFADLAFGHPGIGFNNGLFVAWTGTDAAHHLNVAKFEGF